MAFLDPRISTDTIYFLRGKREDRIAETYMILKQIEEYNHFEITDMLNIQNMLLKSNNWKGIKAGFRYHEVNLSDIPFNEVAELTNKLFPIGMMHKERITRPTRKEVRKQ